MPALQLQELEAEGQKFKVIYDYLESSKLVWDSVSKKKYNKK